jgi:DNA-binding response OmpR family regulator
MLPQVDGMEICRRIRARGETPIIMLTARADEEQRIGGLLHGADDYVIKPFSPRELVARVHTVLRRAAQAVRSPASSRFGNLAIDPHRRSISISDRPVDLTPTEYDILMALCSTPGAPWSRSALIERVFGWDYEGTNRTVDTHVTNLRKKLEAAGLAPRIRVETVFGFGYKFVSEHA